MAGDDSMHLPERSKRLEWNFNTLVVIGGLAFATAANVAVAAIAWNDTKRDILEVQDRLQSETERGVRADIELNKAVSEITPLSYQTTRAIEGVAENKKGIEAANARIDRVVESLSGKLDTAIESINKVATRVEVLSSKLDDAQTRATKTNWQPVLRP
jgi:chromosome segregation ATPase